jgi:hypothetical protein
VAALGHLPVPDDLACQAAAQRVRAALGSGGEIALGGAGGRFTALFERLAIDWLTAASQKAVGERLGLSWDEIHGIMERAVERGLERREAEKLTIL